MTPELEDARKLVSQSLGLAQGELELMTEPDRESMTRLGSRVADVVLALNLLRRKAGYPDLDLAPYLEQAPR